MRRYRTEVVIPADRTLVLHLPDDMPEGHAVLFVQVEEGDRAEIASEDGDELADLLDSGRHDIEWWEEFEEEPAWGG